MIWLAWRRHRTNLLVVLGLLMALGAWMAAVEWQFHTAPVLRTETIPGFSIERLREYNYGPRLFWLPWQVSEIHALLLAVPCVVGVLLGTPLVAGEYDDRTNRLAWTQGIGRTRWLVTKWVVAGIPLVAMTVGLAVGTHLWSFHVIGATQATGNLGAFGNGGRLQPGVFPVSGVVPVAYALFAFALGTTLGALLRRVTWAVVGTVVVYGLALLVMTTTVRPVLAPQFFAYDGGTISPAAQRILYGAGPDYYGAGGADPWLISSGYQFVAGYHPPAGTPSPEAIVLHCEYHATVPSNCIAAAHLEYGSSFQPAYNYWKLQWRESAIYVAASVLLLALGLWAVRRWRA